MTRTKELSQRMHKVLGLLPEAGVLVELSDNRTSFKPKLTATPITQKIADMDLPVSDWDRMEREIEEGYSE